MRFVIVGNGIAGISAAHAIRMISSDALITIVSDEAEPGYSACVLSDYVSGEMKRDNVDNQGLPGVCQGRDRPAVATKSRRHER